MSDKAPGLYRTAFDEDSNRNETDPWGRDLRPDPPLTYESLLNSNRDKLLIIYGMASSLNMIDPDTDNPKEELTAVKATGKMIQEALMSMIKEWKRS